MAEVDFYQGLTPEEMAALALATTSVTYPPGRTLYTPQTPGDALFVVGRGRVNIYRLTADGRKLVTATMGRGAIFGIRWLTGQAGSFAEVVEEAELCVLTRADLERLIHEHPRLALRMIEALAAQLEEAETRLVTLAYGSVAARLAATLLRLAGEGGRDVVGLSHQELAELVGASRETVTRILDELHARGVIEPHRRHIRILDRDRLRTLMLE